MSLTFLQLVENQVVKQAERPAIQCADTSYSYQQLWVEVDRLRLLLRSVSARRVALTLSNCPAWIALDLAAAMEHIILVSVPHFFSATQVQHLIKDAQIDHVINDTHINIKASGIGGTGIDHQSADVFSSLGTDLLVTSLGAENIESLKSDDIGWQTRPRDAFKISYTSGTTGDPKGVLISRRVVDRTVRSLLQVMDASAAQKHLSVLPYSLLLENIVGIYAVLASGGCCFVPDFVSLGISGSSKVDWLKFASVVSFTRPSSMIMVPALLQGLMFCVEHLALDVASLQFIAVGGAPISIHLLDRAQAMGLPVFQGYGMTECGSVVCLNMPGCNRAGSVGKPLPHIAIRIGKQGEIIVRGADFNGYTKQAVRDTENEWATGDLGYFDDSGFLYVTARKSSTYSTAYGRNVAPEWVESELDSEVVIAQSAVFGEGQKHNVSVLVPIAPEIDNAQLDFSVEKANQRLPDYAQIGAWARAGSAFELSNGQQSPAGSLRREQIYHDYRGTIQQLFIEVQA
jgi:long-chain acyl-CoA synthetase